jgi:hypothetical protein
VAELHTDDERDSVAPAHDPDPDAKEAVPTEGAADEADALSIPPARRHRLLFAAAYPRDEALDALVDAFEAGNYARVRVEAPQLAQSTDDPAVARAARDLAKRLEADPLAVRMVLGAGVLLLFLTYWFFSHGH